MSQEKCSLITAGFSTVLVLIAATACSTGSNEATAGAEPNDSAAGVAKPVSPVQGQITDSAHRPGPTKSAPAVGDTSAAGWTAGVVRRTRELAGAATLHDVRAGKHENFDRIVFTFGEEGIPSYHIEYIDRPVRSCGSGQVVPLSGDAWLAIRFTPANAHDEHGRPTVASRALAPRLPNLLELKSICDFEAMVEWVAAVRTPSRFRVLELQAPPRLAVDIRHR